MFGVAFRVFALVESFLGFLPPEFRTCPKWFHSSLTGLSATFQTVLQRKMRKKQGKQIIRKQERHKKKHEFVVNALFCVFLPQNGGAQWEFMKEIYIQRTRELMIRNEQCNGGSMNAWKTEHLLHVHFFMMEKVGKSNNG